MMNRKSIILKTVSLLIAGLFIFTACAQVSAQEVKGLLQAMEGKEMVIKLDDGTTVKITVENQRAAADAQQLVGKQVEVKVRVDDKGARRLDRLERRGRSREDEHFTGKIESITADTFVIGGKTFKVNATTELDEGLKVGVEARVEFITLDDGSLLALEIETDEGELRFSGKLDSLTADTIVVAGKTFKRNTATRMDDDVAVGKVVRVRFTNMADGSMLATRVQVDNSGQGNQQFDVTGRIDSISATAAVIDGKTFKIDANTRLDQGLVVGARARVQFDKLPDGSMLATRIQIDRSGTGGAAETKFRGKIESISTGAFVIGGKTFKVTPFTKLDDGLVVGKEARVEFVILSDGSMAAIEIETDEADANHFVGIIESMTADTFVIGGKTFKVNNATKLDDGLAVGVKARVEFTTLSDGSMVATEIETPVSGREAEQRGRETEQRGREAEPGRGGGRGSGS
ncbi:MAG: hypothetical protein HY667_01415 [Chloroflexi bacterium]|nr:hypothetical protein [Chloroflexota bacterium]